MNDTHLLELSQFQFPSIGIDRLTSDPYQSYVQDYKDKYGEYKFYLGFINPTVNERAKIYRAIDLCCSLQNHDEKFSLKDFIIFNSSEGLIIKCKHVSTELSTNFNHYLSQDDNCIFVPDNCDKLDQYNYSHYRRMLNNFTISERINCKVIRMNENNNILLFLSSEKSFADYDLKTKWYEYIHGGIIRKCQVASNKLCIALKVFSWVYRSTFSIDGEYIELVVKSSSLSDFESRLDIINNSDPIELNHLNLDFTINDEYEAFGLLQIISKQMEDVSHIIPLVGTNRVYYDKSLIEDMIYQYQPEYELPDGCEIFTQDEFNEMSKYRIASLIKAPSGNLYSFLDIYRNPKKEDPHTRQNFPVEFIDQMNHTINKLKGIFLTGFPPMTFNPELITVESGYDSIIPTISFYIRLSGTESTTEVFWIIPDLRDTEYSKITFDAIGILVKKWSDGSLFKNSFPYTNIIPDWRGIDSCIAKNPDYGDIHLVFSPIALYVFEQTINNLTIETYPRDIKSQAQNLSNQSYILEKCS